MRKFKLPLCVLLILTLFFVPLMGLAEEATDAGSDPAIATGEEAPEETGDEPTEAPETPDTDAPEATEPETEEPASETPEASAPAYSYSDGIDENGLWEGVKALDFVDLFDYKAIPIPSETHTITDEAVQEQIDSILASYTVDEQITDRAVADGDTVNIDYVGSVDGVEFSGGSTGGAGTVVTIGVTSYIDDFLEQLIGHMPGETFNVEVTFPEDYGVDELNGKDAVFVTTINHIVESVAQELTDEFVADYLAASDGWTTIDEMKAGIREDLQTDAIWAYIQDHMVSDATVRSTPDQIMRYQENAMVNYYEGYAAYFGMEMDEFLTTYMGVASVDELIEANHESNLGAANYQLVSQAIAEDAGITVNDEDVANYFMNYMGTDDYSMYAEEYGMPYLKQMVLSMNVIEYMAQNAVLQ